MNDDNSGIDRMDLHTPSLEVQYKIAAVGEILWDMFPSGPRFGGAPANFACSAAGLSGTRAHISMLSSVGTDEWGQRALESLQKHGVDTSLVSSVDKPTGKVFVELDSEGCASYEFAPDTAWDNLSCTTQWEQLAAQLDVACFGSLGQRSEPSRQAIQQFVAGTPDKALRIFDVNLRPPFFEDAVLRESLELATVLKLNDEELPVVAALCDASGSTTEVMQQIARDFDLQVVALTRGPEGSILIRGREISQQSGFATQLVDTVGAGDAFTATLALGLLDGRDLSSINRSACEVAAFVCSQPGATPDIPKRLMPNG